MWMKINSKNVVVPNFELHYQYLSQSGNLQFKTDNKINTVLVFMLPEM